MSQYEETIKWELPRWYDPRYGKFVRVMRSSQPVHIASIASTNLGQAAGGTTSILCSTTFDAYTEGYLTSYGFSHSSTLAEMFFLDGSSTIVPQLINNSAKTQCQITTIDAPFYRVDASHTIAGYSDTGGTACAWATLIKFPIFKYVEVTSTS
jgi:hypothetical protein